MQEVFEKIKERLERERDIHKNAYDVAILAHERTGYASYARACDEAIEIVNQVAEEYTTEREKNGYINAIDDAIEKFLEYGCVCVEWNKGLSKEKLVDDVLRQAVGQVVYILEKMKQKAEECVGKTDKLGNPEQVCEWKPGKVNNDWCPSCEPNSTYTVSGVAWFRKCPYCGKKIKVVE